MTSMNAMASSTKILSRMAHQAAESKQEDVKKELEELKSKNEDLQMRLEREQALVQTSKSNEAEVRGQCNELLQEKAKLKKQLKEQQQLNNEVYKGLQNLIAEKYAESIVSGLAQPEGLDTLNLDLESVQNLYEICVSVVKNTNDQLKAPLYKKLLAEYLQQQQQDSEEEEEE